MENYQTHIPPYPTFAVLPLRIPMHIQLPTLYYLGQVESVE
jgi:hypothetical protein